MQIHGLCIVQNEADVIGECLSWALRFCDRIWVWDLGSSDGTCEAIGSLGSPRVELGREAERPYSRGARIALFQAVRAELPPHSWVYLLDADEFAAADPRALLRSASAAGAALVRCWHLDFHPTPRDLERLRALGAARWEAIPLFERLRFYRLAWAERRFLRAEAIRWELRDGRSVLRGVDGGRLRAHPEQGWIRHYRYRSPAQVARRFATRRAARERGHGGFRYDRSPRMDDFVRSESECRLWSDLTPPRLRPGDRVRVKSRRLLRSATRQLPRWRETPW